MFSVAEVRMDFLKYVLDSSITEDIKDSPKYIMQGDIELMRVWKSEEIGIMRDQIPHDDFSIITRMTDDIMTYTHIKEVGELVQFRVYQFKRNDFIGTILAVYPDGGYSCGDIAMKKGGHTQMIDNKHQDHKESSNHLVGVALVTVNYFLEKLADKKTRMANHRMEYRNRDKAKRTYITRNVTYISNVEYLDSKSCSGFHKTLKWSHSWVVRGSWVKIRPTSIGKDRNGIRNQTGRTWRVEHVKNPHLPSVDKLRIVT